MRFIDLTPYAGNRVVSAVGSKARSVVAADGGIEWGAKNRRHLTGQRSGERLRYESNIAKDPQNWSMVKHFYGARILGQKRI